MSDINKEIIDQASIEMDKTVEGWNHQLSQIRTGRANANMLNGVMVNYYGEPTPINQTAQINAPEPQLIVIRPYDKGTIGDIIGGINAANLGFNPIPDAELIRINIPPLTEDIRKELVKKMNKELEQFKIQIRNTRREAIDRAKRSDELSENLVDLIQEEVQQLTDKYIKKLDELAKNKEKELMTI